MVFRKRLALLMVMVMVLGLMPSVTSYATASMPGARSVVTSGGDVYLGGNYIEVGIDLNGWFGASDAAPAGFHPQSRPNVGMVMDADGFDVGSSPTTGDFFLPGGPVEGYGIGYRLTDGGATTVRVNTNPSLSGSFSTNKSLTNTSSGDTLSATHVIEDANMRLEQKISFNVNDKYFKLEAKMTNLSGATLYDVRYFRKLDPDQDLDLNGTFNTKNKVVENPPADARALVYAKGPVSNVPFLYVSFDPKARASVTASSDPYSTAMYQTDGSAMLTSEASQDTNIAMTFAKGNLAAGASVSMVMYNSLDPDLEGSLGNIGSQAESAYLDNLSVVGATLSPSFSTGTSVYTALLPVGTTEAFVIPTFSSGASVTISGTGVSSGGGIVSGTSSAAISVHAGSNPIEITVTSGSAVGTISLDLIVDSNYLSSLTLSSGTLSPAFSPTTVGYSVTYPRNTTGASITVAPQVSGAAITINGTAVTSGSAFAVALSPGLNGIPISVTSISGAVRVYTVNMTVSVPDSGGSSGGTATGGTSSPATPGADVIVNGVKASAGSETVTTVSGRTVQQLMVNSKTVDLMIDQAIKASASSPTSSVENVIKIPVTSKGADEIKVQLTGDVVKKLDDNKFTINIESDKGNFLIPAKEMQISEIAKGFATPTALENIVVEVQIQKSTPAVTSLFDTLALSSGWKIITEPIDFKIIASSSQTKESIEINQFDSFIERQIPLPKAFDLTSITTGVRLEPNGTFTHIPTISSLIGGNNYVSLFSLTNSNYSVMYNPVTVASVANHWSKAVVNDFASRTIIENPSKFSPDAKITRGEFASLITRALGIYTGESTKTSFTDVSATNPNAGAISAAVKYNLLTGYKDGSFKPDQTITREEAMVIYAKALKVAGVDTSKSMSMESFKDHSKVSSWAMDAANIVTSNHVMHGTGNGYLSPKGSLTNAEAVVALKNLMVTGKLIEK